MNLKKLLLILLIVMISCNEKNKNVPKSEAEKKDNHSPIRYNSKITFDDYKTDIHTVPKNIKLDLKSNKEAINYRTRLIEAFKIDTVNFAGHYSFVYWGCGSPCQISMVIDRRNGKIYDSPTSSLGYNFRSDSKLLISNPPNEKGFYDDCFYCKPIMYEFDEKTKKFTEIK